jgi:hypothetical protein
MAKKFRVTEETTFGQARVRGVSKKEFNRRQKISITRRQIFRERKLEEVRVIRKPRVKVKKPKKEIQEELIEERRFRKQVVLNFRSGEEPYAVSIRAITINPEITERGLLIAVQETKSELDINFENFTSRYLGFEETEIPSSEDTRLNDFRVHVEVLIRKGRPINFIK